jgi:YfiH family protein
MPDLFHDIPVFSDFGIRAFVTTRELGSLSTSADEPAAIVSARWDRARVKLAPPANRLATARQVHGAHIVQHGDGWTGWLRSDSGDGHFCLARGTGLGVSVADCVPVFLAHPSGAVALLHAGWRGIAAGILQRGITMFRQNGFDPGDLRIHFGPAICGKCYQVGRDVYFAVSGRSVESRALIDLRAELAGKAAAAGVRELSISEFCTKCDGGYFFSARAGDPGRQFAFIVADDAPAPAIT